MIADVRPAVTNEHGTAREGGALDDLFGIQQDKTAAFKVSEVAITGAQGKLPEYSVDTSLKLAGGTARGRADKTPTMIIRVNCPRRYAAQTTLISSCKRRASPRYVSENKPRIQSRKRGQSNRR